MHLLACASSYLTLGYILNKNKKGTKRGATVEPFKLWMNEQLISTTADIFKRVYVAFNAEQFRVEACEGLDRMELKERASHIMAALDRHLPEDFDHFNDIALSALHPNEDPSAAGFEFGPEGLMGVAAWPLTDLVTKRGLDFPEKALPLLKEVTKRFSAEFAIRPFLDQHTDYTLSVLSGWLDDPNRHVRRLISEGSRPRLPWGMQLRSFVADPQPILPFLEALKDDPEEYVRRSVANNLNDIAKDHASTVAAIARVWLQTNDRNRIRLVKHACRTLIKQGDADTLKAFGYLPVKNIAANLHIETPAVSYGDALEFRVEVSGGLPNVPAMVDYAIHFVKANGGTSPKVFKWKDSKLDKNGSLQGQKKHTIKPITTRVYYPGMHKLEVLVNGVSVAVEPFELLMEPER